MGRLVGADSFALPDHASLISDVDVEADVIVDKAMDVGDHIRCLTS